MSIKAKIRDLQTDKCKFEIFLVNPEEKDNFKIPYVLAIPENIKNNTKLIVETNNRERNSFEENIDYSREDDREFLIDNAIDSVIGNKNHFGKIEFAKNVEAPIIMPILPAVKTGIPYFQQLSRECFEEKDRESVFYRIDMQVCEMISDTKKTLEKMGITLADKIFLNGYSSSGIFAQRFAFLHPEIVDTALIGGAGGTIPMPPDCLESNNLEYPLGTKNYLELTGKEFDLENYKKINFNYYLAEFEEYGKSPNSKNEIGLKAPMHDMSYMDRSVESNTGRKFRSIFGIGLWKRFANQIQEYEKNGYKIRIQIYKNKIHENCNVPEEEFKNVYEEQDFPKSSKNIREFKAIKFFDTLGMALRRFKYLKNQRQLLLAENSDNSYSQKVESIDDIELGRKIEESMKSRGLDNKIETLREEYKNKLSKLEEIYDYPLETTLTSKHVVELAQNFFQTLDASLAYKANSILSGNSRDNNEQFVDLQIYPFKENLKYYQTKYDTNSKGYGNRRIQAMTEMPNENSNDMVIYVPFKGDLRDLYSLVHEVAHSFDSKNGDNSTRKILGEVAPQVLERMLEEFLLNMSPDDKNKYGIDTKKLEEDIRNRRITTFISRYDNIKSFNELQTSSKSKGNRVLDSRYMLAMMYQVQFMKISPENRKNKLTSFIEKIEKDEFEEANKVIGLEIKKENTISRNNYISDMINEIDRLINPISDGTEKTKLREKERDLEK